MLNEVGFIDYELVADTGFNSSPVTKGVLFRARKPRSLSAYLKCRRDKKKRLHTMRQDQ